MSRFQYKIIADKIGNKGGYGRMQPHAITTHHSAVVRKTTDDPVQIAKTYCSWHKGHMPYHFFIPYNDDNFIYVTQWLKSYVWHNSNYSANKDTIAVVLDGYFHGGKQTPRKSQLLKYKQLLDDLSSNWFSNQGWTDFDKGINPKDNTTNKVYKQKTVKISHYHNEVAQPGHATACCGTALIPYVLEYRNNSGNVNWGDPVLDTCAKKLLECAKKLSECENRYNTLKTNCDVLNNSLKDANAKLTKKCEDVKAIVNAI